MGSGHRDDAMLGLIDLRGKVAGGLTYSGRTLTGSPEGWWVGFDCAHYMDTASVCTEDYVADQCKSLAEQIAAVAV